VQTQDTSAGGKNQHRLTPRELRLPLDHPEYRYSVSRNPYQAKVRALEGRVYSDNDSETHRGRWRERFADAASHAGPRRPLHVEIGCNAGHVVLEWAARDPGTAFIGVDWKFKPIFRGAEKSVKRGLNNLILLRAHADRLHYMFGSGEIDFLALYFPDPWPKKAQLKNRWLTAARLRTVAGLVRPGGVFHLKTDHLGYFEWMEAAIREVADLWEPFEHTRDLHAGHPAPQTLKIPDVTLFESLFIKDGIKINSVKLRRL
jgi:tRNA (guanine-N7-)-methyltransferase